MGTSTYCKTPHHTCIALNTHMKSRSEKSGFTPIKSMSWFNPSRQLSTRQPLTHSPRLVGWGENQKGKSKKIRGLR